MKKIIATGFALAALGGCATETPEVKVAQTCDVPAALLAPCGAPADIKVGVTFGEMIEVSRRDREALRECTQRHEALARAIAACKAR
jgi:hypothetical protein